MTKPEPQQSLEETTPVELLTNIPGLREKDRNGDYPAVVLINTAIGMYDIPGFVSMTSDPSTDTISQDYLERIKQYSIKLSKAFQVVQGRFTKAIPGDQRYGLDSGIERLKAAGDEILFASNQGPLADILYALMLEAKHEELVAKNNLMMEVFQKYKGTPIPKMHFAFAYPYQYKDRETDGIVGGDEVTAQLVNIGGKTDILFSGSLLDVKEFKDVNPDTLAITSTPRNIDETTIDILHNDRDKNVSEVIGILVEAGMVEAEVSQQAKMRSKLSRSNLNYSSLRMKRGDTAQGVLDKLAGMNPEIGQIIQMINTEMTSTASAEHTAEDHKGITIDPILAESMMPQIDRDFALDPEKNPNEGDVLYVSLDGLSEVVLNLREQLFTHSGQLRSLGDRFGYKFLAEINKFFAEKIGRALGSIDTDETDGEDPFNFDPLAVHVDGRNNLTILYHKNLLHKVDGEPQITPNEFRRLASLAGKFADQNALVNELVEFLHTRFTEDEGVTSQLILEVLTEANLQITPRISHATADNDDDRIHSYIKGDRIDGKREYVGEPVGIYGSLPSFGGRMLGELISLQGNTETVEGHMILQAETLLELLKAIEIDIAEHSQVFRNIVVNKIRGMGGEDYQMYIVDLVKLDELLTKE